MTTIYKERLDHILIRLGYVNETQIARGLTRQKARGGRLGGHMVSLGYITEAQLVEALAEQYDVPGIVLGDQKISKTAVKKIPGDAVERYQTFPYDYDAKTKTLYLAMVDPTNSHSRQKLKEISKARKLEVRVAPQQTVHKMIREHYREQGGEIQVDGAIELPTIFPDDTDEMISSMCGSPRDHDSPDDFRRVLVVSRTVFHQNFLGPLFEREGCDVTAHSQLDEISAAMQEITFDQILVASDMYDEFLGWIRTGRVPAPHVEITALNSVSGAVLDNPATYRQVTSTLFRSLKLLAHFLCTSVGWKPHHNLICADLRSLASGLGLQRLAVDGLQVAAHLLIPARPTSEEDKAASDGKEREFVEFETSLEVARSLRFPWGVENVLQILWEIHTGRHPEKLRGELEQEMEIAAQVLGLVWHRHLSLGHIEGVSEEEIDLLKTALRGTSGAIACDEVVEAYIRIFEKAGRDSRVGLDNQIFLVGDPNEVSTQFRNFFESEGIRTLEVTDLSETQDLCERFPPTVIVVNHDQFPEHTADFARLHRENPGILLYAFTRNNKQSEVMELMDAGIDDVLVPPFNYEIFFARIMKALEARAAQSSPAQQGFSASFDAFSFFDLIQALGGSKKSVCIDVDGPQGEKAKLYLRDGRMIHAESGSSEGPEAVYQVVAWRNQGSFVAEPIEDFPPATIFESNDSIILEGCRLLDEVSK